MKKPPREQFYLPKGLSKHEAWKLAIKQAKRDFRGMKYVSPHAKFKHISSSERTVYHHE